MHVIVWHRLMKEDGRAVLSGKTATQPGKGVWIATLARSDGGQTTTEAIAKDGIQVYTCDCYCGYDRHTFMTRATVHLFAR